MADLLLDFVTFMTNKALVKGDGIDAFRDAAPEEPDSAVIVYEYQGTYVNEDLAGRSIQIVARDKSATKAKEKARAIFNSFNNNDEKIFLTATRWCVMSIRQAPFKIKVDNKNRVYYGFNIGVNTKCD